MQEIAATLGHPSHLAPNGELTEDVKALEDDLQTLHTAEAGQWGSCVRLMHVVDGEPRTSAVVHLDNNEAALCMALVSFDNQMPGQRMLAVGTAKDLKFYPRSATGAFSAWRARALVTGFVVVPTGSLPHFYSSFGRRHSGTGWRACMHVLHALCMSRSHVASDAVAGAKCVCGEVSSCVVVDAAGWSSLQAPHVCRSHSRLMRAEGFVRLYQFAPDGRSLIPWHKTSLGPGAIPAALAAFQSRLLVGCGKSLRLMECGRKKLLRKCEFQGIPNLITTISTSGYRIYVGDSHESFHFLRYKKLENSFYIFADDMCPRCAAYLLFSYTAGGRVHSKHVIKTHVIPQWIRDW